MENNKEIRASEGQAQTSAAICRGCDPAEGFCKQCRDKERAAQLADKTDPSASVCKECSGFGWKGNATEICQACRKSTAPTAQQSTAGGAVPDERAEFEAAYLAEFGNPESVVHDGVKLAWHSSAGIMWRAARAAAAPLQQVQSEALDAARWQECLDVSFRESDGDRQFVGVMFPRPAGDYASTSAEFEAAVDVSRAAQQAIKPSVDNDGGVA